MTAPVMHAAADLPGLFVGREIHPRYRDLASLHHGDQA